MNAQGANLCHDGHQGDSPDVRALSAHVAPSNDLEACLLCGIDVVRNESFLHDLLLDRMSAGLDGKSIGELWSSVVVHCHELRKSSDHVQQCNSLADPEHD